LVWVGTGLAQNLQAALTVELGTPGVIDAGSIGPDNLAQRTSLQVLQAAVIELYGPHCLLEFAKLSLDDRFVLGARGGGGEHLRRGLDGRLSAASLWMGLLSWTSTSPGCVLTVLPRYLDLAQDLPPLRLLLVDLGAVDPGLLTHLAQGPSNDRSDSAAHSRIRACMSMSVGFFCGTALLGLRLDPAQVECCAHPVERFAGTALLGEMEQ